MKTTIDLPEDVLYRAKMVAAERRTTLKELVIEGLERAMTPSENEAQLVENLIQSLSVGRNTQPIGPLQREEIYDRAVLRGY